MATRKLQIGVLTLVAMALSAIATADDAKVLTWEDLIPKNQEQLVPPDLGMSTDAKEGGDFDWEDDSFEEAMSMHYRPTGIVKEYDKQRVKLPGFVVPIELGDEGKVSEFLLVPYFGACIHYPAPPPNQIVYVTMKDPIELASMWEPVWLTGELRVENRYSELGSAGYTMQGDLIEEYVY